MPKITYDPAMRKTPGGARVYSWWSRIKRDEYDACFEEFVAFYEWAIQTLVLDARLKRYDPTKPYSPEN